MPLFCSRHAHLHEDVFRRIGLRAPRESLQPGPQHHVVSAVIFWKRAIDSLMKCSGASPGSA